MTYVPITLWETPSSDAHVYLDTDGYQWRLVTKRVRPGPVTCAVCGRTHLPGRLFWWCVETRQCACNDTRCVHVEPFTD